jgi:hypothetical protein
MSRRVKVDHQMARRAQNRSKKKSNTPINFTTEQLINFSQTPIFIDMIVSNNWMDNIYGADHLQNERLMFVRRWWKENIPPYTRLENNPATKMDSQLKLF